MPAAAPAAVVAPLPPAVPAAAPAAVVAPSVVDVVDYKGFTRVDDESGLIHLQGGNLDVLVRPMMEEERKASVAKDAQAAQEFRDQIAAAEADRLLAPEVAQSGADPEVPPLSSPVVPAGTSRPVISLPPQDVTFRRRNEGAPVYGKTLSRPEDLGIEVFAGMTRGEAVEHAIDHGWVASKIVEGRNDTFTRDSLERRRAQMTRAYKTDTPEFRDLERRLASIDAGLEARTTYRMTSPEGVTVEIGKRLFDYFVKINSLEGRGQVREQAKSQSSEVLVGDSEAGWPGLTFSLDRPFGRFFWKGREIDPVLLVPEYAGRTYPFQEEIPEGGNQALPGAVILEVRRLARERAQWFAAQDPSFVALPASPDDDIDLELAGLDAGNESESAELRSRLSDRVRRAFEAAGGPGALNVIQVNQSQAMAGAIADADGSMLRRLLHAENLTARAAFSSLTGLDLGGTARAASEVVDSFCAGIRKGRVHQWGLGWGMDARAERDDVGQGQFDSRAAEVLASDQVFFARAVALQYISRERAHEDARRMAMQIVFPLDQDLVSLPDGRFIVRRKGAGVYISATGERFAVEPTSSGGVVIDLAPKISPDRIPQEFDDLAAAVLWMDSADEHRAEMQRVQRARMAKDSESAAEAAAVAARLAAEERSLLGGVGLGDILGMDVAVSEAEGDSAKLIRRRQKVSAADFELAARRAIDTRDAAGLSGYADTYPLAVERLRSALAVAEKAPALAGVSLTIREGVSPDSFDVFESALVVAQFSARDGVLDVSSVRHIDPNHDRTARVDAEIDRFVGEMERVDSVDMAAVQAQIDLIGVRWENIRARLSVALETLRDAHFELTALAQRGNMSVLAGDLKARESRPQGLRAAETTIATFRHFAGNQPVPVNADLLLEYLGGVPDIDAIRDLVANPDGGPAHPGGPGGGSKKGDASRSDEGDAASDGAEVADASSGDRPSMAMAGDGWTSFLAGEDGADGAPADGYDARHVVGGDAGAAPAGPTAEPVPELDRPAVTRFSVYSKGPGVIELSGRDGIAISWSERTALVGWARRQGLVSRSVAFGSGFSLEIRGSQALLDQIGAGMPLSGEQSQELLLLQSSREGRWWGKVFAGVDVDPAASLAALRFISGRDASFAGVVDDAWIPALSAVIESDGTPLTSAEIMRLAKASFESGAGSEAEGLIDVGGGVALSSQERRGNHGNESGQGEADPGVGSAGRGNASEGQSDGAAGGVDRQPVDAGLAGASQGSAGGGSVPRAAEGPGGAGGAGSGGRDVEEHGGVRDTAGHRNIPGAAVAGDEGLTSAGGAGVFGSAERKFYLVTQRVDFGDLMRLSGLDPLDAQAYSADRVAEVVKINPDFGFQAKDAALGVFCLPVDLPEQLARRFGLRRVLDGDLIATRQRAEIIFSNMIPNIEGYAELSEKEFEDSVRNWLAAGEWQYSAASASWLPRLAAEVRARVDGHLEAERVTAPRRSLGVDAARASAEAARQLGGAEVELTLADIERDLLLHADDAEEVVRLKLKRQAVLSEQGRVASRALLEQHARELKGFAYSISDLFGDGAGKRLVGRFGKSERDTLLMERFGVSREHAHDVNNSLDGERPIEVSKEVAERLMQEFPAVGAMVAEAQAQTEESGRLYAKQVAETAQKEILTFRDDAPEVAQPVRVGGGAITIQAFTLSGPRSTRANLYEVPGHRGVQLAVHEYRSKVSGEIGYRVYLPASGQLVQDSNGVSSLSDALEVAALRIRNRRYQILAKAAMDAVRAPVDAARDSGSAAADQSAPADLPAGQPEAAAVPPAAPTSPASPARPSGVESSLREDRRPAPEADHKPSSQSAALEEIARAEPASPVQSAVDHIIADDDGLGEGGQRAKFRANIEAIRILKRSPKQVLSTADRKALAAYVGWGGLKGVFDPQNKQWESERAELRALLTPQEWESASRSQLNAHYTSRQVVDAMYAAISRVGFSSGRILEPSIGTGNFFGLMPKEMRNHPGTRLTGVELDLLTSQIAKELYPSAKVIGDTGFQDVKITDGYFDLTVGNPPFGSEPLSDDEGSEYNGWSIHNYFFAKSIEKTRPGGLVSMVVSHTLMDRLSPKMREWMAERVDLVDAVRLPNTAFLGNAGTQVVTDILIFQRKESGQSAREGNSDGAPVWTKTQTKTVIDEKGRSFEAEVNEFFVAHPEKVLGREAATGSMYRAGEYTVEPADDWKERLVEWAKSVPEGVYNNVDRSSDPRPGESSDIDVPAHVRPGHYFLDASGAVRVRLEDSIGQASSVPWDPPNARSVDRMRSMILLRELLRHQMLLERSKHASSEEIESHRRALAAGYNLFLKNHGHLNSRVNRRIFGDDLDAHLLQALEFDYDQGVSVATAREREIEPREPSAKRADILSRRVLFPRASVEEVSSARDALLVCLDEHGMVDLSFMGQIYPGHSEQQIVDELGDLLFQDPVTSGYKTRDEYLAGDVKTKLEEARRALSTGGLTFERNVTELEAVQPADLPPSRIHASLGASWIPTRIFHEFIAHVTESPLSSVNAVFVPPLARWSIQPSATYSAAKARGEFGTPAMSAFEIIESLSSNRAIEVKRKDPVTDKYVTDIDQTEAARAKADLLRAEWQRWLWSDADRASGLAEVYNKEFNRTIKRKYDGQHLKLHGSSAAIELIAHQKAGVWRGVQERRLLLDQVVGAGKTYEMAATSQEMRRLGMCSKPLFAVPNHLTLQWRDEFARLYPGSNVLAATPEDFEGDNRRKLFAKIATGRWDAVIVGHSSLKKLAIPIDDEIEMLREEVEEISDAIWEMKSARGDRHIERDMQRIKARLEEKLKGLVDRSNKDRGVDFQDLGIDALFVDELHEFKNLAYQTRMNRVAGLGNPEGSEKARDLYMKVRWMQRAFGDRAILVGGTGTPVSNSLSEMYTMQKFFCTPEMIADGTFHFDNWARLFGEVSSVYEVSPTGSGYRLSERFSKFKNLPLLMGRYAAMAETTTLDDLKKQEEDRGRQFPVPKVAGGRPTNIVAERSVLQRDFFGVPQLDRADNGAIQFGMGDIGGVVARFIPAETGGSKTPEGWIMARDERLTSNLLPRRYPTKEEAEAAFVQEAVTPKTFIPGDSLLGQFSRLAELSRESKGKINALSLTSAANKASLDYRLIDPSAPDFPDSKINIAVDRLMGRYEKWMKDKGTQLIFCDLSVPKSAKGSMGGKPKRVYVRNDKDGGDALGHASGTLHLIDGHSDLTYFLVKGSSGGIDAYDTHTGAILQRNCGANRQEAIATLSRFANDPEKGEINRQRWMAMRLSKPLIEDEEIDEYVDRSGIEVDPDREDAYLLSDAMALSSIASGFSVYDDVRAKLIARGVPPQQIEFIHDHDTPVKKQKLFQRVRSGDVRFLLGSTPKMGAGTNVQDLLVGMVHLDAPWRPSDMEQREGRIIRRGNKLYERDPEGFEVEIDRMATKQTLDTRRWQILEHKARGIGQMRCYDGSDSMEDVAAEAANAADMKAAASGNPLILRETQLSSEIRRIEALRRAHVDNCASFAQRARHSEYRIQTEIPENIERLSAIQASLTAHDPECPVVTIGGKSYRGAKEVADAIKNKVEDLKRHAISNLMTSSVAEMNVRGFDFKLSVRADNCREGLFVQFSLSGVSQEKVRQSKLVGGVSGSHVLADALSNLESIPSKISLLKMDLEKVAESLSGYKRLAAASFDQEAELQTLQAEHGRVRRALIAAQRTEAVDDSEMEEFRSALALRRLEIEEAGFGDVLQALDLQAQGLAVPTAGADGRADVQQEEGDSAESMAARPSV